MRTFVRLLYILLFAAIIGSLIGLIMADIEDQKEKKLSAVITTAEAQTQSPSLTTENAASENTLSAATEYNEKLNAEFIEERLDKDSDTKIEPEKINTSAVHKKNYVDDTLEDIAENKSLLTLKTYKDLELYNVNTKESIEVIFRVNGEYVPSALDKLDQFMRDWRRDAVIDIDPKLYVLMDDLYERVDGEEPINLISGHRSKITNDKLRAMGRKTAKKSQHVLGKAADITIPGVPVSVLREEALEMHRGGVGYYPENNFVHVDTGKVRQW